MTTRPRPAAASGAEAEPRSGPEIVLERGAGDHWCASIPALGLLRCGPDPVAVCQNVHDEARRLLALLRE